ncbi:DUF2199 domain-containing protein [Mesorhizobium sp. 131-2-1]|uniref:DUF2199 domain-containing protein n=1 Tax=Mesorhizobium sp. 131-2-1 TaxID=2744518 RepID=UPI00193648B1|nr:DUF2199 domain-containing protein [Mesorhizobium sp. 131-2-1]BCG94976.1 hypothetical protein MesoLj131a_38400 [Mesorhizobium sp. 131-2-1]
MSAEAYRWRCACCDEEYTGLPMDVAFDVPVNPDSHDDDARLGLRQNDDFCEVRYASGRTDRFIRCLLPLPVHRLSDEFCFGVWMSLSERSWNVYRDGFDSGQYEVELCFGYLMHDIPEYPSSMLMHANVVFQPGNQRPKVFLHEADHPLVAAQRDGVDVTQIERWVALSHRPKA